MKKFILSLLLMTAFTGAGCTKLLTGPQATNPKIVTQVEILIKSGTATHQVFYSDPHKITKVLNYLRRMETWNIPEQHSLDLDGTQYRIVLHLSDGSQKKYEQIRIDYFKEARWEWKKISQEYALQLPLILAAIPSDAI